MPLLQELLLALGHLMAEMRAAVPPHRTYQRKGIAEASLSDTPAQAGPEQHSCYS